MATGGNKFMAWWNGLADVKSLMVKSGGGESKEEDPMLKNKKKDTAKKDGCGCPHKKKKKLDSLTPREMNDACWKNYEQRGTKKKGGKTVPNCVPKSGKSTMKKDSTWASGFKFDGKALCMNSQDLAATDIDKAKRKKNAQSQPRNKIMAGTRNT